MGHRGRPVVPEKAVLVASVRKAAFGAVFQHVTLNASGYGGVGARAMGHGSAR
jgi:hypothetical protein